jgi:hypothetical protein
LDYNEEVAKVEHLRDNPKIGLGEKPAVIVVDCDDWRPLSTAGV